MPKGLNAGLDLAGGPIGTSTSFAIACAANPAAPNLDAEIGKLAAKIAAGATFAQTQPVYDVAALDRFFSRAESRTIPVLIGLIPPKSLRQALYFANEVPGLVVPPEILDRMRRAAEKGPEFEAEEGMVIAAELCSRPGAGAWRPHHADGAVRIRRAPPRGPRLRHGKGAVRVPSSPICMTVQISGPPTIGRGEITLHNVFVSLLGASTLNWLVELVPRSAFGGGFMGRHIIAARDNTERLIPLPVAPHPDLQSSLVVGLQKLSTYAANITWDSAAYVWFDRWYKSNKTDRDKFSDDRQAGYMERKPITLIKVSIIKTALSWRTITTAEDLAWSLRLLDAMEEDMLSIFESIGSFESRTIEMQLYDRLREFLRVRKYLFLQNNGKRRK